MGDRKRLQVDQTVYDCHDIEEFRVAVLLLRVRVSAVLDLASGGSAGTVRTDWEIRAVADCDGRQYVNAAQEGDRNRESGSAAPRLSSCGV